MLCAQRTNILGSRRVREDAQHKCSCTDTYQIPKCVGDKWAHGAFQRRFWRSTLELFPL